MVGQVDGFHGCYFKEGLGVHDLPGRGKGVFTKKALFEGDLLLVERCIFSLEDPVAALRSVVPDLFPRLHDEIPKWLFGWPVGHLPVWKAVFTYLKLQMNCYWRGLFSFGSQLNHSCLPTAVRYIWDDGWSVVFALQSMEIGDEVTVCYGFMPHEFAWQRQWNLRWKYGFTCQCKRCLESLPLPAHLNHLCKSDDVLLEENDTALQGLLAPWLFAACDSGDIAVRCLASRFGEMQSLRQQAAYHLVMCRAAPLEEVSRAVAVAIEALEITAAASTPSAWVHDFANSDRKSLFEAAMSPVGHARWLLSLVWRQVFGILLLSIAPVFFGAMSISELKEAIAVGLGIFLPCAALGVLLRVSLVQLFNVRTSICAKVLAETLLLLLLLAVTFSSIHYGWTCTLQLGTFWDELPQVYQAGFIFIGTYGAAVGAQQPLLIWERLSDHETYVRGIVIADQEEKDSSIRCLSTFCPRLH